jgi:DNA-damage-inducible protein D
MSELTTTDGGSAFDRIKLTRPDGSEFWSARALQGLMGYARWENMREAVARAQQSASNTGENVSDLFREATKKAGGRPSEDFELTRRAAYLVAMNGDPRKDEVAAAQGYFASRAVQAESAEQQLTELPEWAQQQIATIMRVGKVEIEQARQAVLMRELDARVASFEGAHGEFTALGYAKLNDLPTDRRWLSQVGRKAAAAMRAKGQEPHQRQDATFGLINVYPTWALDTALAEMPEAA